MKKYVHLGRWINCLIILLYYVSICHAQCSVAAPYRPEIPLFSEREWDKSRDEDSVAKYYCPTKYRSVNGLNASSTCFNRSWTKLDPSSFKCERVQCSEKIPQVPMYGDTDWNRVDRYAGQKIRYFCIKYYYPTVQGTIEVTCGNNGQWTPLPTGYDCVSYAYAEKLGLDPQIKDEYDYYRDGPRQGEEKANYYNWFLYVTLPCFAGLGLVLFCCLCCTRTDSPIFWLCRGNTRNDRYLWG